MKKKKEQQRKAIKISKSKYGLYLLFILVLANVVLGGLNLAKVNGWLIPEQPLPLVVNNTINFDQLTLEQKIAQMVVVLGVQHYSEPLKAMQLGGIHLHAMQSEEQFRIVVKAFQKNMLVPFFVTVDLEGCISPFSAYKEFKANSEVKDLGDAFQKGKIEGKYLSQLGVSINFAPVVDLEDSIWNCRSFKGTVSEITELANSYLLGLQDEGIIGTIKHYPGKTLVIKDPHKYLAAAEIDEFDLSPYEQLEKKGVVKAIMVSHLITYGKVNSEGKPSDASKRIIDQLKQNYQGLIISDEINMLGFKNFYENDDEMYREVFKGGADIILNFNQDPQEIYHMIRVIKSAVESGEIPIERIDASVKKILTAKGFEIREEN